MQRATVRQIDWCARKTHEKLEEVGHNLRKNKQEVDSMTERGQGCPNLPKMILIRNS